jgi:hypothetical protein
VIAPLTLATAVLALRAHPVAPLLALGPGVYALYTYSQMIIGQEYLRLPGNVERPTALPGISCGPRFGTRRPGKRLAKGTRIRVSSDPLGPRGRRGRGDAEHI